MSIPKLPEAKKKSRYRRWREKRMYGEEISRRDVEKIVKLNKILREDGRKLGIQQISIEIVPREFIGLAAANDVGYRIKDDGMISLPSSIQFDYKVVDELNIEELRSLAWHELGHYICAYYFGKLDDDYWKDYSKYLVIEAFADEFAYNRFGDTYMSAIEKIYKFAKNKKDQEVFMGNLKDMKRMAAYRKKHNKPFWLAFAKELGVKVELNVDARKIVGIRPNKSVLKGLYEVD
jgi:hypothetical protein